MKELRFLILSALLTLLTVAHWVISSSPAEEAKQPRSFRTVTVTQHGTKMHEAHCPHIRKTAYQLSQAQAEVEGYGKCETCMLRK